MIYLMTISRGKGRPKKANLSERMKIGLNSSSFHSKLINKTMNLDGIIIYGVSNGFHAIEFDVSYFPSYPELPNEAYLEYLKEKTYRLDLEISGISVQTDFLHPDIRIKRKSVETVKEWIPLVKKLGAGSIHLFIGSADSSVLSRSDLLHIIVKQLKECCDCAQQHGVVLTIQNDNNLIRTADHSIELLTLVNSPWLKLIVDISSLREEHAYFEFEKLIPYTANWLFREFVYIKDVEKKINISRIMKVFNGLQNEGYMQLHVDENDDPDVKLPLLVKEIKEAILHLENKKQS